MSKNHRLMDRARKIDPVPPEAFRDLAQSPDAQETLNAILSTSLSTSPADAPEEMPANREPRIARPRLQFGFAAGAALLLVAVGTVILVPVGATSAVPVGATSAEAKVREAAVALGETESLRGTIEQVYPNGEVWTFTGEFQGADGEQTAKQVSSRRVVRNRILTCLPTCGGRCSGPRSANGPGVRSGKRNNTQLPRCRVIV